MGHENNEKFPWDSEGEFQKVNYSGNVWNTFRIYGLFLASLYISDFGDVLGLFFWVWGPWGP